LCAGNRPVPIVVKGTPADVVVGRHIDSDCTTDIAKRRIYTNRCHLIGCKRREVGGSVCASTYPAHGAAAGAHQMWSVPVELLRETSFRRRSQLWQSGGDVVEQCAPVMLIATSASAHNGWHIARLTFETHVFTVKRRGACTRTANGRKHW
jgi:hypothetical protein